MRETTRAGRPWSGVEPRKNNGEPVKSVKRCGKSHGFPGKDGWETPGIPRNMLMAFFERMDDDG